MQDPNEDTEWNAILRQHGILPEREIERSPSPNAPDLNEREAKSDDEWEAMLQEEAADGSAQMREYNAKRMKELKAQASESNASSSSNKYPRWPLPEIDSSDFTREVTQASHDPHRQHVVCFLYNEG